MSLDVYFVRLDQDLYDCLKWFMGVYKISSLEEVIVKLAQYHEGIVDYNFNLKRK